MTLERVPLGRTGLMVSRIGLGASYPAPTSAYERAFERGINYFYWGSRRSPLMGDALRGLLPRHRDDIVLCLQSYARFGWMLRQSVEKGLRDLAVDRCEVLLLGWHNSAPSRRVIDAAMALRDEGKIGHVAMSGHKRTLFPTLRDDERYGIWMVRYNACHRGAETEVFPSLAGRAPAQRPGLMTYTTTRWGQLCDPKRTPAGERTPSGSDCYRFALSRPEVDLVMAGPGSDEQMDQAIAALEAGAMSEDELTWMRRVGDHIYGRDVTTAIRD
jgi:aryl-alcohol dehydrogenase-like predicted oxidoreductase